jgi:hypothetical protein
VPVEPRRPRIAFACHALSRPPEWFAAIKTPPDSLSVYTGGKFLIHVARRGKITEQGLFLVSRGARPVKRDREHLKLLVIFHYVLAVLIFGLASIFIFHLVMGILIVRGKIPAPPGGGPPAFVGWILIGLGAFMLLMGYSLTTFLISGAICLGRRKAHTFCLVVAGISCLWAPLGTGLGVCTILVLMRRSVKDLFAGRIVEEDVPESDEDEEEPIWTALPAEEPQPPGEEPPGPPAPDGRFSERPEARGAS